VTIISQERGTLRPNDGNGSKEKKKSRGISQGSPSKKRKGGERPPNQEGNGTPALKIKQKVVNNQGRGIGAS